MSTETGIETEKGYYAVYRPVDPVIDQAYFKNYDTLATTNAMIYVLVAFVACALSFVIFYSASRLQYNTSITQLILSNPALGLGLCMMLLVAFLLIYFRRGSYKLMTLVVPVFTLIIFASLFGASFFGSTDDQWRIEFPDLGISNTLVLVAVGLVFALTVMFWISSDLRVDRLRFQSPAFFAFVFFAVFFSAGMIYVAGSVKTIVDGWEANGLVSSTYYPLVYTGMALAILVALVLIDAFTNSLINLVTGFSPKRGNYLAQSPELANATYRSKQMVLAVYSVLILVPFALVYWFKEGLLTDQSSVSIAVPLGVLAVLFPVLAIVGVSFMEIRRFLPSLYRLFLALVLGFAFFVLTTQFIPWGNVSVFIAVGLLSLVSLFFLIGKNLGSGLAVTMILGFVFMAVKSVGQSSVTGYTSSFSDRMLILGLPILIFGGIWLIYTIRKKQGWQVPLTLLVFGLSWAALYSDQELKDDYILEGRSKYASIGIDFAIVTSVLSVVVGLTAFSSSLIDAYGMQTERLPFLFNLLKFVAVSGFSYLGAYFYDYVITNERVKEYLSREQSRAENVALVLEDDLRIAFDVKEDGIRPKENMKPETKVHFVHIPKTGGTAIKNAFCDDENFDDIDGHQDDGGVREPGKIYFGVVRDPYERYKSLFYYLKEVYAMAEKGQWHHDDDFICGKPMPVMGQRKFDMLKRVGFDDMQPKDLLELILTGRLDEEQFLFGKPQVHWICEEKPVDYILHQETLQEDFDDFCDPINKERVQLSRSRPTRNKRNNPPLDEETRALVRRVYREDFEKFGYPM